MKKLLILILFLPFLSYGQIKISTLPTATTISAADYFILNQGTTTKKIAYSIFKWDADSVGKQISDSLALYGGWNEDSTARVINDSLVNYASLQALSDSLALVSSVSLGTAYQIPFSGTTDFQYSDNFRFDGKKFILNYSPFNIYIGDSICNNIDGSSRNISIGFGSGNNINNSSNNVFIGYKSGYAGQGSGNILLGYQSGYSETGSNKLYIENSNSATPLIYGDFANDTVRINGTLDVTNELIIRDTSIVNLIHEYGGGSVSFGTDYQIPYMKTTDDDFSYSERFVYDSSVHAFTLGLRTGTVGSYSFVINGGSINPNTANGSSSFCGGVSSVASGSSAFAYGSYATASGTNSRSLGHYTKAHDYGELAIGTFNIESSGDQLDWDSANSAFVIGNGNSIANLSNAFQVFTNGDVDIYGILDHSLAPNKPKIYTQSTEPDIPNNTTAFWVDSDDSKYYLILDFSGSQKKTELL